MPSTSGATTPRSKSPRVKAPAEPQPPQTPSEVRGPVSEETREAMIRLAAYRFYERRGFVSGSELQDWLEAEMEVDRQLSAAAPEQAAHALTKTGARRASDASKAAPATRKTRKA